MTTAKKPRRRTTTAYRPRRRRSTSSTIGAALGTLLVTLFLKMSWGARIGIVLAVLVLGAAWVLWSHRADLAAAAQGAPDPAAPAAEPAAAPAESEAPPADPAGSGPTS